MTQCFDKSASDFSGSDVLDLLRSFVLCRQNILTILDSEDLCAEYHRKLNDELIARKQRGDSFFATPEFQSSFEKGDYNRIAALATELQITELQHNVYLLDCFESDITFTVHNGAGAAVLVNVEVDGIYHEKKRKTTFCQLRDKELTSRGIHVARITARGRNEIDAILRKTVHLVRANAGSAD